MIIGVSAICRRSLKGHPACLSIVRFSYFPTFQSYFVEQSSFLSLKVVFFASRTFTWYHYCSRNQSGCGRPEAEGQVRARVRTPSMPWQGIDYTIWLSQCERITIILSASQHSGWKTENLGLHQHSYSLIDSALCKILVVHIFSLRDIKNTPSLYNNEWGLTDAQFELFWRNLMQRNLILMELTGQMRTCRVGFGLELESPLFLRALVCSRVSAT